MTRRALRRLSWGCMLAVVVVALVFAATDEGGTRSNEERAAELARTLACPQCDGQSVAESNAPIAVTIAADLKRRVDEGQTDDEIRAFYIERYGEQINLTPSGEGFDAWVWVAPFLLIGAAAGGVGLGMARWRDRHPAPVDAADVELVAANARARATVSAREGRDARMATRLDPDALSHLTEERDFLLRSIDDLGAELAAGDLSQEDHDTLRDDYTRRAAEVIRAIEEDRRARSGVPATTGRQLAVWVAGLALVGALGGVAVARNSGTRLDGELASGSTRLTVRERLGQAQELFANPDEWDRAIEIYDDVLVEDPGNVDALTYRGWLQYRDGAPLDEVIDGWDAAVALDPTFPDVRVFRIIAFTDAERWDEAAAELEIFDSLDAPAQLGTMLDQRGVRGEVLARSRADLLAGADSPTLADLDLDAVEALTAADWLLGNPTDGGALAAVKLYDAVLAELPEEPEALLGKAVILTQAGLEPEAAALLERFDALDPDTVPPVLVEVADSLRDQLG